MDRSVTGGIEMKFGMIFCAIPLTLSCIPKSKQSSFDSFNHSLSNWEAPDYRRDSHGQSVKERISADGPSGPDRPADQGRSGSGGISSGNDGGKGGPGAPGVSGQAAGSLRARVRYDGDGQDTFRIDVDGKQSNGSGFTKSVSGSFKEPVFYLLTANGGKGQAGGRGGEGGSGATGHPAPRPSLEGQSTYGGTGGDGGPGGPGGAGGDGGNGGELIVEVRDDQTEILWHVRAESAGAPGGERGPGGPGGAGGSGGPGEGTVQVGTKTEYDTDAEGNQTSREVPTYGTSYSGSSGSSGSSGTPGAPGKDGTSSPPRIRLLGQDGKPNGKEFKRLFEIEAHDLKLTESIPDGVYEPGEVIWVSSLGLKNIHEMPSPAKKTAFILVEDGGISPPNEPVKLSYENGFNGNEQKNATFDDFAHYFTLIDLTKEEHLKFAAQLDDREATKLSGFSFSPKLMIGGGQMTLSGGTGYNIEPPVYVAQDPKTFRTQYPIINHSDNTTIVPFHVVNISNQIYGTKSQFTARLPGAPASNGSRRVRIELAYLRPDESGQPADKYLLSEKLSVYLEKDGKRFAETQNLLKEPLSFEVDEVPANGFKDFLAGFDIWDDKGLIVGSRFIAEFRVFVSPLPGQEPTKLIWTDSIDFVYTAEFRFAADHRLVIFNKQVQCEFPNAKFRKKRIMDRIYIGKSFNKENENDKSNLTWNVQFATGWWSQPRTPLISFNINEHYDYFDIFSSPTKLLYSEEIRDFLNNVYIPQVNKLKDLKPINAMSKCEYIPSDRWDTIMRTEIAPRQFRGHMILDGVRTILSPEKGP